MTNLSVNLNKVALLRNSRSFGIPSVIKAASTCIQAGAHRITVWKKYYIDINVKYSN